MLETADLFLGFVPETIVADDDGLSRLLEAASARWTDWDRVVLRVPGGGPAPALRFRPHLLFLSKDPEPRPASDSVSVTTAEPDDHPFVHDLLARALVAGYATAGRSLPYGRALAYARASFPSFGPAATASAVVARIGGALAGAGTWQHDVVDELSGAHSAEIVDVFVLEAFRATGVSAALANAIEAAVLDRGVGLLGHVVAEADGGHETVVARLRAAGWKPAYDLWVGP